jgi:ubiquinone/menaquinone biosynthesis C-methylase UbiE
MVKESLESDASFTKIGNLFYQIGFQRNEFEPAYLDIRKKEGRLFSDLEVQHLPNIPSTHSLHSEWQIRKRSTKKLIDYLAQRSELKILEIGCGNGWLCNNLSKIPNATVVGLDVNELELKQASSVFRNVQNVTFILGDILTIQIPLQYDFIIFASSLQYFPRLEVLFSTLLKFLHNDGEIHILDTPFYDKSNVIDAKARSSVYFESHGSKMHDHYFHHTWESLSAFKPVFIFDPATPLNKLKSKFTRESPFPWIRIKKGDYA